MRRIWIVTVGGIAAAFAATASAGTPVNWLNTAGGSWTDPANWSIGTTYPNNGQPAAGNTYDAVIAVGSSPYTITNSSTTTVDTLSISNANASLLLNASTFGFGIGTVSAGSLELAGGTLNVSSSLLINGNFVYRSGSLGTVGSTGVTTIASGGTLTLLTGSHAVRGALVNNGMFNFDSATGLSFAGGTFTNNGTLQVNAAAGSFITLLTAPAAGTFVHTGTLSVGGGGTVVLAGTNNANSTLNNATIAINAGTFNLGVGSTTFTGTNLVAGAGTLALGSSPSPTLNRGTLNLAATTYQLGDLANVGTVNISGIYNFNGGALSGASGSLSGGAYSVLAGGALNVGSGTSVGAATLANATLNNAGTLSINANNASLTLSSATLNNGGYLFLNGGTFNNFGVYGFTNTLLRNTGTIVTSGSSITPAAPLQFDGGTLLANATTTTLGYATTTFAGDSTLAGSGTVQLSSGYGVSNSGTLSVAGRLLIAAGSLANSGVVNVVNRLDLGGGSLSGGTFNVINGGQFNVASFTSGSGGTFANATLNNAGTITIDAAVASLTLSSGTLNNAGYLNLNGGTFSNFAISGFSNAQINNTGTLVTSGSSITPAAPLLVNGGTILANASTTSLGYATTTFAGNSTVAGSGTVQLNSGYGVTNTGTLNLAARTQLTGGSLSNSLSAVINVVNRLDLGNGSLSGGTFNVVAGGQLSVASTGFGVGGGTLANATLNNAGTITVDAAVASLTLSGGTLNNASYLNLNSGTLNNFAIYGFTSSRLVNTGTIVTTGASITPAAPLFNDGGTLIVNATQTVLGYGTTTFAGNGTISGSGTATLNSAYGVSNTGTLNLVARTRLSGGSLNNSGVVNIINRFDLGNGSLSGGTFNVLADAQLNVSTTGFSGGGTLSTAFLNNYGTVTVDANIASLTLANATFNNFNTLNLNGGSFNNFAVYGFTNGLLQNTGTIVTSGASITPGVQLLINGGTILANAGTTGFGYATTSFSGNSTIAGSGTAQFLSGYGVSNSGTLNLLAHSQLTGGSLNNSGVVNIVNTLDLGGGSLNGGTFVVQNGGQLNVASLGSGGSGTLSATLNNAGTINIDAAVASLTIASGTLNNAGYLNLNGGSFNNFAVYGFTNGLLVNTGTIVTSGASITPGVQLLINGGTILANAGTTGFGYATTSFSGNSTIAGSGTAQFLSGYGVSNSGTLNLGGRAVLSGGSINNSGTVRIANGLTLAGGSLSGGGTYLVESGGSLNVATLTTSNLAATLTNFGTVTVPVGGTLNVAGGTFNNAGTINLAANAAGPGIRNFSAGSLNNTGTVIASVSVPTVSNFSQFRLNNVGTFVVAAGTVQLAATTPQISGTTLGGGWTVNNASGLLFAGNPSFSTSNGTITLNGPTSAMPSINALATNNGLFSLLNGRQYTTAVNFTNNGTLGTDAGSTFTFNGSFTNNGTVFGNIQNNGTTTLAGSGTSGAIEGGGTAVVAPNSAPQATRVVKDELVVGDNAQLSIEAGGGTVGTSVVHSLDLSANNAKLNLNDHDLVVDYAAPQQTSLIAAAASPQLSTIVNYLTSGFAGGAWNGPGLNSAAAAADTPKRHALGVAEAATVLGAGGGTFSGQLVDGSAVLVKYTYIGDTNLDGKVDVADLGALASHWQASGIWSDGDFNYDGFINVVDLGALASNWQAGVPGAGVSFAEALRLVDFNAAVPEPSALGLLSLSALCARRRTGRRTRPSSRTSASAPRASGRSAA